MAPTHPTEPPANSTNPPNQLLPPATIIPSSTRQSSIAPPFLPQLSGISRNRLERKLRLAMLAIKDTREAPWYGPWAIALELLFLDLPLPETVNCVTIPQLPAIRQFDPAVEEDRILSDDSDEESNSPEASPIALRLANFPHFSPRIDWSGAEDENGMQPSTPTQATFGFSDQYHSQPSTPVQNTPFPLQPPNTAEQPLDTSPLDLRGPIRSTRVPDFTTVLQIFSHHQKFLDGYTLLITEVKPPDDSPLELSLSRHLPQVLEQAKHVFADNRSINEVGCLLCIGQSWTYFDISRSEIPQTPKHVPKRRVRSSNLAPSHVPVSFDDVLDLAIPAPFLAPHFAGQFLDLYTGMAESLTAFRSILTHLYHWRMPSNL